MKSLPLFLLILIISASKVAAQQNDTIIIYDHVKPPVFGKYYPNENWLLYAEANSFNINITRLVTKINFSDKILIPRKIFLTKNSSLVPSIALPIKAEVRQFLMIENNKDN